MVGQSGPSLEHEVSECHAQVIYCNLVKIYQAQWKAGALGFRV